MIASIIFTELSANSYGVSSILGLFSLHLEILLKCSLDINSQKSVISLPVFLFFVFMVITQEYWNCRGIFVLLDVSTFRHDYPKQPLPESCRLDLGKKLIWKWIRFFRLNNWFSIGVLFYLMWFYLSFTNVMLIIHDGRQEKDNFFQMLSINLKIDKTKSIKLNGLEIKI